MSINITKLTLEKIGTADGVKTLNESLENLSNSVGGDGETVKVFDGFGTPESTVTAGIGSLYMRKDGTFGTSIYIKESGTGATGWFQIGSVIENRTSDPSSPEDGRVWFRTDV